MKPAHLYRKIARVLIGLVLLLNTQCAIVFLTRPEWFVSGFELSGVVGEGIVRGFGILFVMWSVPYWLALINPIQWKTSLYEAVAMQAVGLFGESILLVTFPAGHPIIQATITRFIVFDGLGLVCLILSTAMLRQTSVSSVRGEQAARK